MNDHVETTESDESDLEDLIEMATVLAYASVVWWAIAGVITLYWVTGGTVGLRTLWVGSDALSGARDPWLVSLLWVIGIAELGLAVFSVVIARRWTRSLLLALINTSAFLVGLTLVPYVAVDSLMGALVTIDVLHPVVVDRTATAWRLVFWNPWWIVGVLLYCAGAWLYRYLSERLAMERGT